MNLFRKAGSAFEETKRKVLDEGGPAYVCESCEEGVDGNHEFCPHCGEAAVESVG